MPINGIGVLAELSAILLADLFAVSLAESLGIVRKRFCGSAKSDSVNPNGIGCMRTIVVKVRFFFGRRKSGNKSMSL